MRRSKGKTSSRRNAPGPSNPFGPSEPGAYQLPQQPAFEPVAVNQGFAFAPWSSLDVLLAQMAPPGPPSVDVASSSAAVPPSAPPAAAAGAAAAAADVPSSDGVELERVRLLQAEAFAELEALRARFERLSREAEDHARMGELLRHQVAEAEERLRGARLEVVQLRREAVDARDVKLLEELRREAAEAKRAPELRQRLTRAEEELRAERASRPALEKQANAWVLHNDSLKQRELAAREAVSQDVAELEHVLKERGTREFLQVLYRQFPPKNGQKLGDLVSRDNFLFISDTIQSERALDRALKQALVAYHCDKQDFVLHGLVWKALCTEICAVINSLRS